MSIDAESLTAIVREAVRAELYALRYEDNKRAIEQEQRAAEAMVRSLSRRKGSR